ncbi:MAG: LytTR family DNA-binding domain-containing protein [Bacteroidales bacterium]|nr:LytTR family DNA-binding domain-containing protein [Bacteroidales bacterium]MDD3908050.1 LytTR family DNA-binding domain-containing protein [Bacteroidales bacterium]MDD4712147.1 LytTR family DNA-binding domain-containing protein [Bacteroidales bacterium]
MNYSCIAVDDEPLALEKMVSFVERLPFLTLQATFDRATDALAYLTANQTDLLFLDIQMETLTGLDLLAALSQRPQVILTTAYSEYALKGYEFEVADYLLKPYSFVRFSQAVNKAVKRISEKVETAEPAPDFFFVKADYRLVKVMLADILYIEGMRDFRCIHTLEGKILTQQTFASFETQLPVNQFLRVHKSYLVSLSKIESVEKHRIKIGKALLPISESYREVFYRTIGK